MQGTALVLASMVPAGAVTASFLWLLLVRRLLRATRLRYWDREWREFHGSSSQPPG